MPKAEQNFELGSDAVSRTIDVEHALAVLRSENARLKDIAERNAKTEAQNQEIRKKNSEFLQRENIKLQAHLLASQDRVYELQTELLRVREIINSA